MSELTGYRFSKTHEWVRLQDAGEALVGITDHAQAQLGDVIFLELPAVGDHLEVGARLGAVESVKAASDLYSPVAGEVTAVNTAAESAPEVVNQDPYEGGWLIRIRVAGEVPEGLMDPESYKAYAESDQH